MLFSRKKKGIIKVNIEVKGLGRFETHTFLEDESPIWLLYYYPQSGTEIGDAEIREHLAKIPEVKDIHWTHYEWRYLIEISKPRTITSQLQIIFSFSSHFNIPLSAINIIEAEMYYR